MKRLPNDLLCDTAWLANDCADGVNISITVIKKLKSVSVCKMKTVRWFEFLFDLLRHVIT